MISFPKLPRRFFSFLILLSLATAGTAASAETFFLRGGEALEATVLAAGESSITFVQKDGTALEIPFADLEPLSVYRALRSRLDLNSGENRLKLGDRCLALGLPELALEEYEAAAARGVSASVIVAKKSLARSVLAHRLYEKALRDFEEGNMVSARAAFEKFIHRYADKGHLLESARDYLGRCEAELAATEIEIDDTPERDEEREVPRATLDAIDRELKKIDDLLEQASKNRRRALVAGQNPAQSRASLVKALERSKLAKKKADALVRRAEGLPDRIVAEVAATQERAKADMIDSYLKLAHVHVLVGDHEGAMRLVKKVLLLDPTNSNARSLLRLIQTRAAESNGDDGTTLEDRRRYRIARNFFNDRGQFDRRRGVRTPPTSKGTPPPPPVGGGRGPAAPRGGGAPAPGRGPVPRR